MRFEPCTDFVLALALTTTLDFHRAVVIVHAKVLVSAYRRMYCAHPAFVRSLLSSETGPLRLRGCWFCDAARSVHEYHLKSKSIFGPASEW